MMGLQSIGFGFCLKTAWRKQGGIFTIAWATAHTIDSSCTAAAWGESFRAWQVQQDHVSRVWRFNVSLFDEQNMFQASMGLWSECGRLSCNNRPLILPRMQWRNSAENGFSMLQSFWAKEHWNRVFRDHNRRELVHQSQSRRGRPRYWSEIPTAFRLRITSILGLCISVGKAAESIQNTSPLNW